MRQPGRRLGEHRHDEATNWVSFIPLLPSATSPHAQFSKAETAATKVYRLLGLSFLQLMSLFCSCTGYSQVSCAENSGRHAAAGTLRRRAQSTRGTLRRHAQSTRHVLQCRLHSCAGTTLEHSSFGSLVERLCCLQKQTKRASSAHGPERSPSFTRRPGRFAADVMIVFFQKV